MKFNATPNFTTASLLNSDEATISAKSAYPKAAAEAFIASKDAENFNTADLHDKARHLHRTAGEFATTLGRHISAKYHADQSDAHNAKSSKITSRKFHSLPNFTLPLLGDKLVNINPYAEHQREKEANNDVQPGSVNGVFGEMNPPDQNDKGAVQFYAEGSPVNGAWEQSKLYKGYQIATRATKSGDTTFYELQVGGSNQVTSGTQFTSREAAIGKGEQIVDSWETSPAIKNSGTSEGVKKSWDARRGGTGASPVVSLHAGSGLYKIQTAERPQPNGQTEKSFIAGPEHKNGEWGWSDPKKALDFAADWHKQEHAPQAAPAAPQDGLHKFFHPGNTIEGIRERAIHQRSDD